MNEHSVDRITVKTEHYLFNKLHMAVLADNYDAVKEVLGTINSLMTIETMVCGKDFVSGIGKDTEI